MKQAFTQRILNTAGIPDETLPRQPLLELCGDRRVLIENHQGVARYGTDEIHIRVSYGLLVVRGTNLKLCRMLHNQMIITGCVDQLELFRGRDV